MFEELAPHPDAQGQCALEHCRLRWNEAGIDLELESDLVHHFERGELTRAQISQSERPLPPQRHWLTRLLRLKPSPRPPQPVLMVQLTTRHRATFMLCADAAPETLRGLPFLELGPGVERTPFEILVALIQVARRHGAVIPRHDVLVRTDDEEALRARRSTSSWSDFLLRLRETGVPSSGSCEIGELTLSWNPSQVALVGVSPGVWPPPPFVRFLLTPDSPQSHIETRIEAEDDTLFATFQSKEHTMTLVARRSPTAKRRGGLQVEPRILEAVLLQARYLGAEWHDPDT